MSNYFEHLALRALGQVRKSDAQPVVRSRFEPEALGRRELQDAVGRSAIQRNENSFALDPADPPDKNNSERRGPAGQAPSAVSESGRGAGSDVPSSSDVGPLPGPATSNEVSAGPDGPTSFELSDREVAAVTPSEKNVGRRWPQEPASQKLFNDPVAAWLQPTLEIPAQPAQPPGSGRKSPTPQDSDSEVAFDERREPSATLAPPRDAPVSGDSDRADVGTQRERASSDRSAAGKPGKPESQDAAVSLPADSMGRRDTTSEQKPNAKGAELFAQGQDIETEAPPRVTAPQTSVGQPVRTQGPARQVGTGAEEPEGERGDPRSQSALFGAAASSEASAPARLTQAVSEPPMGGKASPPVQTAAPPAPQVHIRIGRIEVRAPAAKPAAAPPPPAPTRTPSVSLSDYLKQTRGRG